MRTTKNYSDEEIIEIADYMIKNSSTVRECSKHFGVSKSAIFVYMTKDLKDISISKYELVSKLLKQNKDMRAHRGGVAKSKKNK